MSKRKTKEEFIRDATAVHGSKYTYESVVYVNNDTAVTVNCLKHGPFKIKPSQHTSKGRPKGCRQCGIESKILDWNTVKNRLDSKFPDKLIYDESTYKGVRKNLDMICRNCGYKFSKMPWKMFKRDVACTSCENSKYKSRDEWIELFKSVQGSRYDYSTSIFKGSHDKIDILCFKHGIFSMEPIRHLSGQGCRTCNYVVNYWNKESFRKSCLKNNECLGIFYILRLYNDTEDFYKIGITSLSVLDRYKGSNKLPYNYEIQYTYTGSPYDVFELEKYLKYKDEVLISYKPTLKFSGSTECFTKDIDIVDYIRSIIKERI